MALKDPGGMIAWAGKSLVRITSHGRCSITAVRPAGCAKQSPPKALTYELTFRNIISEVFGDMGDNAAVRNRSHMALAKTCILGKAAGASSWAFKGDVATGNSRACAIATKVASLSVQHT